MKIFKYLSALVLGAAALTGCQDKFDETELEVPVATQQANISIADFKACSGKTTPKIIATKSPQRRMAHTT